MALCGQRAGESIATWPSFINKDEVGAFGLQPAEPCSDSTLPRTAMAEGDDLGVRFLGNGGYGKGLFMNISPDRECARLVHG
jgi:hypothetical protein